MYKGFEYRIYPNKTQEEILKKTFSCTRFIWNYMLNYREGLYEQDIKINYYDMAKMLHNLKHQEEYSWLNEVDSIALQQSIKDLDRAYVNFFKKITSKPNFKSKHNHNQSYRTQCVRDNIRIEGNKIIIPKVGKIKFRNKLHIEGNIKNATIRQVPSGKYFISICADIPEQPLKENYGGVIGIDVGLKHFYTDSDGNKVSNPKYLSKTKNKLAKAQRILSKKQKGSNNREKARIKVAKIHERIQNQRKDFLHKESLKLVRENQIIGLEDLNVEGMLKNHKLAKAISDVSWSSFKTLLKYKAEQYGTKIMEVDRFYASSKTCNVCGTKSDITSDLSVREWECPHCHSHLDRDINAAINIRNEALRLCQTQN